MTIWSAEIKELETLHTSIKGKFSELEKELEQLIETKDANVVMLYSRRCLEVIITDLCECELNRPRKTEPLKGIIDKLSHEEKVPSHIIASMLNLNSLSTFGAHPKEFDPEQVKPVLSNLNIIIKWYLKYKTQKVEAAVKEKEKEHEPDKMDKSEEPVPVVKPKNRPVLIISGILLIGIILVFALDLFNIFHKDKFENIRDADGRISIAVMPFENLTGDTTLNWFQRGISSLIINGLGTSSELAVRDDHTMFEVMESMDQVYTAAVSPSLAKEVAEKVRAETYIRGSFQGREGKYRIMANLVNTETGDIIWTHKVEGDLKSSGYLSLADSLCSEIKDYLEIKALEQVTDYDFREAYTKSPEAYRYFIEGMNSVLTLDYESAIKSLKKALEIDSTFTFAAFYIAYANCYSSQFEQSILWTQKAYNIKDRLPSKYQPWLELWYACYISEDLQDIIRYCNLLEKSGIESRLLWFDLGVTYQAFPQQYDKAVEAFEKVEEISLERGGDWKYELYYDWYLYTLHKVGKHEKEKEIAGIGLKFFPNSWRIIWNQAVCALSMGDTLIGNELIAKFRDIRKEEGRSESVIESNLGFIYYQANILDKAEVHRRKAYELEPENLNQIFNLAYLLIKNDINVHEGMELAEKGLKIDPDDAGLIAVKGMGYYKQGRIEEAIQLYKLADEKSVGFLYELDQSIQEAERALASQDK